MLNILNHQEIQIETTMRWHFTLVRMAIIKNTRNNRCWLGWGEKGTFVHCWWDSKLVHPLLKTVRRLLEKLKIEQPYHTAILLLRICLKKTKTLTWKDAYISMFIATLFTVTKIWKQFKCPSINEWIKM